MIVHVVTFDRLEDELQIGKIRSITPDHTRGIVHLVCDEKPVEKPEGQTIPTGTTFTMQYDEETPK